MTSSDRWIFVSRDAIKDQTYKVTDLIEGNEYEFRVAAENKVGTGPASEPSEPFTAKDPWGMSNNIFESKILLIGYSSNSDHSRQSGK